MSILSVEVSADVQPHLHCTVEVHDGQQHESSTLDIGSDGRLNSENAPKFTFTFKDFSREFVVIFHLGDGECCVPVRLQTRRLAARKLGTFTTRAVEGLAVGKYLGRVSFDISVENKGLEVAPSAVHHWYNFESISTYMPFLSHTEEPHEEEEAIDESIITDDLVAPSLMSRELDRTSHDPPFPNDNTSTITAIFHSIAKVGGASEDSYNPVACLQPFSHTNTLPAANWSSTVSDEMGNPQTATILKSVNLTVPSSQYETVGLHLFRFKDGNPMLSAYEGLSNMLPLHFYHRAWISNFSKPTNPSDPLLSECTHVVTSVHLLPTAAEYQEYHGLEVAVMKVGLEDEESHRKVMIVVQLLNHAVSDKHDGKNRYVPPFLAKNKDAGSEYCKLALIKPQDPGTTTAYFFFSDQGLFEYEPHSNLPYLKVDFCVVNSHSAEPWWEACSYNSEHLTIDAATFEALTSERAQQGIRHSIEWTSADAPERSLHLLLRWKTKDMPFLKPLSADQLVPKLIDIMAPDTKSVKSSSPRPEPRVLFQDPVINVVPSLSMNIRELEYQEMVDQLQRELKTTRERNATLVHENGFLQGQLMSQHDVCPATKNELLAKPKSDLVYCVLDLKNLLDIEKRGKADFRRKVQEVQNQLLQQHNVELELEAVREAHQTQQKLIANLRRKVKKYYACYEISTQQEAVILRLEDIAQEFSHQKSQQPSDTRQRPESETIDSRAETDSVVGVEEESVAALNLQLHSALQRIAMLESGIAASTGHVTITQDPHMQAILEQYQVQLESLQSQNQNLLHRMESIRSALRQQQTRQHCHHRHHDQDATRLDSGNSTATDSVVQQPPPSNHRRHPQQQPIDSY